MLAKVFIVIDFESEDQKRQVQEELNEFSNSRVIDGKKLNTMLPMYRRNKASLYELFRMIAAGGVKSVLSLRGAQLIKNITGK